MTELQHTWHPDPEVNARIIDITEHFYTDTVNGHEIRMVFKPEAVLVDGKQVRERWVNPDADAPVPDFETAPATSATCCWCGKEKE
jgi:hypothetical protein